MDMTVEVPELPELTFDEASHIYRLNGDIIPSVSKLMEPLKDQCYGGISKRTLENAAIKGSAVHNSIENWIKFGIDDIPSEHRGYFNGFMEWWKQYKPRVFGSEVRIYHSSGRVGLSKYFYQVAFKIWSWEDATRFYNQHSNFPVIDALEENKMLHQQVKELNGELKRAKDDRDVEHRRCREAVDAEQAAQKKIGQLEAEVHDRDMTIMELKAKLYDLMMKEGK